MAISSNMAVSKLKERNACTVKRVFCCCCTEVMVDIVDSSCCVKSFTKSRKTDNPMFYILFIQTISNNGGYGQNSVV